MEAFRSVPDQKMYTKLFNAITDALNLLEDGNLWKATAVLKQTQQASEELYILGSRENYNNGLQTG